MCENKKDSTESLSSGEGEKKTKKRPSVTLEYNLLASTASLTASAPVLPAKQKGTKTIQLLI